MRRNSQNLKAVENYGKFEIPFWPPHFTRNILLRLFSSNFKGAMPNKVNSNSRFEIFGNLLKTAKCKPSSWSETFAFQTDVSVKEKRCFKVTLVYFFGGSVCLIATFLRCL